MRVCWGWRRVPRLPFRLEASVAVADGSFAEAFARFQGGDVGGDVLTLVHELGIGLDEADELLTAHLLLARRLLGEAGDEAHDVVAINDGGGNADKPVYCCHTSVGLKHWVYPNQDASFPRPTEFAYGKLVIHAGKMGCDLRPIDPAHPQAAEAVCGAHGDEHVAPSAAGYYDPADLGRFGEVGKHAKEAWDKFLAYYTHATSTDGALTRREKSLIALAIAHSKQCPYCIDAHTQGCLQNGATVEQMHEAVHVAAAMAAGIDLVHATQMHHVLRRHGAM